MPERWSLVVGIDAPLYRERPGLPYAEADAVALAAALRGAGYAAERQAVLVGKFATRAAVDSRLRWLRANVRKGDSVLAVWLGRAAGHAELGWLLPCWDTRPDDAAAMSISVSDLLTDLERTKATEVAVLLGTPDHPDAPADLDGITAAFADGAKCVGLLAAEPGEPSHAGPDHGLWPRLVAEAFQGARAAFTPEGTLTARSLAKFLEQELPRRLRKHFEANVRQTPVLLGDARAAMVLAQRPAAAESEAAVLLDPARLRRVVLRNESVMRLKDLSQFRKSYQLPDHAGPSSRKFFTRLAAPDLKADLDRVYNICSRQML